MKNIPAILTISLVLAICILFGAVLMMYAPPMEDISLDLSLGTQEEIIDAPTEYDEKGWTVYTQNGEIQTTLTPDGFGGYTGLELGQTFYFSRVMTEVLDSPTLQLAVIDRNFAVWLDDTLIYTDCPELDNRVGHLTLPMREWERLEPINISLPVSYLGKTLTIAQSSPPYTETGSVRVWPAEIQLYCGYAYESELISESFTLAITAALTYLVGVGLLVAFLRNRDWRMVCLAVMVFLWMSTRLVDASFFWTYYGTYDSTPLPLIREIIWCMMLGYLTSRATTHRRVMWGIIDLYGLSILVSVVLLGVYPNFDAEQRFLPFVVNQLPSWLGLLGMVSLLVLALLFWWRGSRFYRAFCPLALVGIAVSWLVVVLFVSGKTTDNLLIAALNSGSSTYLLHNTIPSIIIVALLLTILEAIWTEIRRHTDKRLLEEHQALAIQSYQHMRHQHQEVMILRHDITRHFTVLRSLSTEAKVQSYLDELIGQAQQIRPVVQSGNTMLDILLNGKLSLAADNDIQVEVVRAEAPEKLPLSDKALCSLVLNILDNAITAAAISNAQPPFIRLDVHMRGNFLVMICENSALLQPDNPPEKDETVPKHGLGLKIIASVVERCNGVVDTEHTGNSYRIQVAIPLH